MTTATIKRLFKAFETAEQAHDKIDKAWELDPMNEELEAKWDELYKDLYSKQEKLEDALVEFSGIDKPTMHIMINKYRDRVKSLIERIA